ncbi:hypothetical protein B0H13DRAFT_1871240 [Mycena leptocephala]|nr:hypothetical protein B0H13DRAFT_1871240 [Mycena leptocephala]
MHETSTDLSVGLVVALNSHSRLVRTDAQPTALEINALCKSFPRQLRVSPIATNGGLSRITQSRIRASVVSFDCSVVPCVPPPSPTPPVYRLAVKMYRRLGLDGFLHPPACFAGLAWQLQCGIAAASPPEGFPLSHCIVPSPIDIANFSVERHPAPYAPFPRRFT